MARRSHYEVVALGSQIRLKCDTCDVTITEWPGGTAKLDALISAARVHDDAEHREG